LDRKLTEEIKPGQDPKFFKAISIGLPYFRTGIAFGMNIQFVGEEVRNVNRGAAIEIGMRYTRGIVVMRDRLNSKVGNAP
jgi:hypothetical protein